MREGGGAEGSLFLPAEDFTDQRRVAYLVLCSALALAAVVAFGLTYVGSPALNIMLGTAATVLAAVVGFLALVRFYSRKRTTHLFIGAGFLGTAVLDGYHTATIFAFVSPPVPPGAGDLIAWTWLVSRLFLSLFLCASWLVWHQEERTRREGGKPLEADAHRVYWGAAGVALLAFLVLARMPLVTAYHPGLVIARPAELVPGALFLAATVAYLAKGDWKRDAFDHWLVVALVMAVAAQMAFLPFSTASGDQAVLAARVLTILSYGAVLTGLMASVYVTFRREGEASAVILKANEALAREVKVRRDAERVLQEEEERLQDFLDHANDLIQSTDPDGRILYVNQAWRDTLGYTDSEIGSMDIFSVVHPESRRHFKRVMKRVFGGESVSDFEVTFQAKDGSRVICSGSSNCRFEGDRPVATRSILRNLTEEIRAERELARSQANVRALFESTGDAIWSVDGRYRLLTLNTAYALTVEAITGRAPAVGDGLNEVVGEGEREWFRDCYERALSGTRFSAIRDEELGGEIRTFELFFNPIEGPDGPSGVVVFSKDISRRRRVEEALRRAKQESEEANRAKSHFMANMSHELRTPLNSVIGFANILLKDPEERWAPTERGYMERILANGKHLLDLINEILDLSKIEAGRMELELEPVELQHLVGETLAQLEGQVSGKSSKRVELRAEWEGRPGPVHTDPGKLKQVLINLVGNALKFTEEGEVVVRIESEPDGRTPSRILVRDTGVGIPKDRLHAIFEAFQQADAGTARRFGGTGLGLTISRSLCTLMGYDLGVDSEVGEGSTFTIHLSPLPARHPETGIRELEAPRRAGRTGGGRGGPGDVRGKKVLVVDDEPAVRTLLAHYLEEMGCEVAPAVDGVDGLAAARKLHPDLITLDLLMPRMDGWEMLRAIKEDPVLREIPVVIVSGVDPEGRGQILGAVDVLDKPVDRQHLAEVLRRTMSRASGKVLVVDDNPDTRLILRRYLGEAGLTVHTAEGGEEAVDFLRRARVDLVLLDLMMPAMDGFTTLSRIRALPGGKDVPVVVLSAKKLTQEERRLLHEQASQLVLKGNDLEERLRGILDSYFGFERKGG